MFMHLDALANWLAFFAPKIEYYNGVPTDATLTPVGPRHLAFGAEEVSKSGPSIVFQSKSCCLEPSWLSWL